MHIQRFHAAVMRLRDALEEQERVTTLRDLRKEINEVKDAKSNAERQHAELTSRDMNIEEAKQVALFIQASDAYASIFRRLVEHQSKFYPGRLN